MRRALTFTALLVVAASAAAQEAAIAVRGATGVTRWENGATLPFAENNMIICDETSGDNFTCRTVGGPLRDVVDFNGDQITAGQNFRTLKGGFTLELTEDGDGELLIELEDPVTGYTADQMFDELDALTTSHVPHELTLYFNNYQLDSGVRLARPGGDEGLALVTEGNIAERHFPATWACRQPQVVGWCIMDSDGDADSDGLPASNSPIIQIYADGTPTATLCQIPTGSACGSCTSGIGTASWAQGDLLAGKIDCVGCLSTTVQDIRVVIGCY